MVARSSRKVALGVALGLMTAAVAAVAVPGPALAQDSEKPSIAVLPFDVSQVTIGEREQRARRLFADMLEAALVRSGRFVVVERARLKRVLDEQDLTSSGAIDPDKAIEAGRLVGARYMVTGAVTTYDLSTRVIRIPKTNVDSRRTSGTFVCDLKLIDSQSGQIVLAERVEAKLPLGKPRLSGPTEPTGEERAAFHEEIVAALARKVLGVVSPIRVLVTESGLRLNRGTGGGVATGEKYDVYASGSKIRDPRTGESLGADEVKVAIITVGRVQRGFSSIVLSSGNKDMIPDDNVCRPANGKPVDDLAALPPIVSFVGIQDGQSAEADQLKVSVRAFGGSGKLTVEVNGKKAIGSGVSFIGVVDLQQGWNDIVARATDEGGRSTEAKIRLLRDSEAPTIALLQPPAGAIVREHKVRAIVQCEDAGGVTKVEVLGAPATAQGNGRWAVDVILAEGTNEIEVRAYDKSGNVGSEQLRVTRDSTAPAVTITEPKDGSRHQGGKLSVAVRIPDADVLEVKIGGVKARPVGGGSWKADLELESGSHWIVAEATDKAGNAGAARIRVTMDDSGPELEVASRVTVNGKVKDAATIVTVNGLPVPVQPDGSFSLDIDLPPDKIVRVQATDSYGNTTERVIDYND